MGLDIFLNMTRVLCSTKQESIDAFYTEEICESLEEIDADFRSYFLSIAEDTCQDLTFCGVDISQIEEVENIEINCQLEQLKIDFSLVQQSICDQDPALISESIQDFRNNNDNLEFVQIFFENGKPKCPNLHICNIKLFGTEITPRGQLYKVIEKSVIAGGCIYALASVLLCLSSVLLAIMFYNERKTYKPKNRVLNRKSKYEGKNPYD